MTGINGISNFYLSHLPSFLTDLSFWRAVYVLSTIPTWYLVDTLGRRVILLSGATVRFLVLLLPSLPHTD